MENYRCIAIGINRYHFLQPLSYAKADAESLHQCLLTEIKLLPEQTLLLTDTSAWVQQQSTYPNRDTILNWLKNADTIISPSPISNLWFFFSGYGVNFQGEDYLMPIDGNPRDIPNTGIKLGSLFTILQQQPVGQILLILDINRSVIGGTAVGQQTIHLAKEMGISVILSSQPNEFSYEAAALGHGMFTSAFLEALRHYHETITLAKLDQYLRDRLPEFSAHHWRPLQTPLIFSPSLEASYRPLFPTPQKTRLKWERFSASKTQVKLARKTEGIRISASYDQGTMNSVATINSHQLHPTQIEEFVEDLNSASFQSSEVLEQKPPAFFLKGLFLGWGAGIMLIIVIFAPKFLKLLPHPLFLIQSQPTSTLDVNTNRNLLNRARTYLQANQASGFNRAIGEIRKIKPDTPFYSEANVNIVRWSQIILDIAKGRAKLGDFTGAIAAAKLVPQDQKAIYQIAHQEIQQWEILAQQQQLNQVLIEAARSLIKPNQASSYNRAIMILRQIPNGQPNASDAQQLIQQWSQQIYLLAHNRATQDNLEQAIQTAQLVPKDTSSYRAAQQQITKWKQGRRS